MENSVYMIIGNCKVHEIEALVSAVTEIKCLELK